MTGIPRPIRAYLDTSVFGGVFDEEFAEASRRVFDLVRAGELVVLLGATTAEELADAPEHVQGLLATLDPSRILICPTTPEVVSLRDAYLAARILTPKWTDDATHVAAATVHGAPIPLSWNFKHLVHWERERGFNSINTRLGYAQISIRSPLELGHDDEDL